jgi:hypothetical protein
MAKPTSQLRHTRDLIANREHDDDEQAKRVVVVTPTGNIESTPTSSLNFSFSYNITGSTCVISETIGTTTYRKTIDWSTNPITESAWV